jgi:mannose-6-phosphate isomerase
MFAPLRFRPQYKSMLWGGTRLLPSNGSPGGSTPAAPVGEAWLLSDVDGSVSVVAGGVFAGQSLRDVIQSHGRELLGDVTLGNGRFPLLLKFIDAKLPLSVQVHPNDAQANARIPGQNGKTEAWVVLASNPQTSRMYAGLTPGVTATDFRRALDQKRVAELLHSFVPKPGDCIFLPAGTVHAIGAETYLFEVQQTSDITDRLYDWDRVDATTGKPRELHIETGLACADFSTGPCDPVVPDGDRLVTCPYFSMTRSTITTPTTIATAGRCRIVVVLAGGGTLDGDGLAAGDTLLIPAARPSITIVPADAMQYLLIDP